MIINVSEAKTKLCRLIDMAYHGEYDCKII